MFAGGVVEAMCSGAWGITDHGSSFRLGFTDEEELWDVMKECERKNGAESSTCILWIELDDELICACDFKPERRGMS